MIASGMNYGSQVTIAIDWYDNVEVRNVIEVTGDTLIVAKMAAWRVF
jgi:hypothetical protein